VQLERARKAMTSAWNNWVEAEKRARAEGIEVSTSGSPYEGHISLKLPTDMPVPAHVMKRVEEWSAAVERARK
jgi:hypothetical protein